MTKTVVFAAGRRPDFPPMRPRKGFTHVSREMLDAWISSDAASSPEQVYHPALKLFTATMVLAAYTNEHPLILRGYEAISEHAPIANYIAGDLLMRRYRETQRQERPLSVKEMVEEGGKFVALEALLLPQKGGGWCIAAMDIRLLLPIPTMRSDIDDTDRAILQMLYEGFSGKEIGQQLGFSHRTIEHRTERLKRGFGARSIAQLVALSISSGIGSVN